MKTYLVDMMMRMTHTKQHSPSNEKIGLHLSRFGCLNLIENGEDLLQAKCDKLERQGVLQDPKRHGVDVRHVSPCFIQQKARAFLSRFKFLIFADLYNSYFQVKVAKKHWKYLAIMTPYRGLKIMTRCGQGLLNSDVELDQVLGRVLGDDIAAGHCLAARDDLFVGGDTIDE